MTVLVLGGTHHVGRAAVEAALARGHEVVTVNRGLTGRDVPGVDARRGDRLDPASMAAALGDDRFDVVLDTWSGAPVAVRDSARLARTDYYAYVSSRSVYTWPPAPGLDETAPVVDAAPGAPATDYPADKRGGELAVQQEVDGAWACLRAGLVLGPYEQVGRLPFWLERIAAGGRVPAPGPHDRPLQYVDGRDLAGWVLDHRPTGVLNTVSRPGHTTMGELLEACVRVTRSGAELVWLDPSVVEAAEVAPWTELPIWMPPSGDHAAMHDCDVSAAHDAGLSCRPVAETVADTWAWLQREGVPEQPADRPRTGLGAEAERRLWEAAGLRP